MREIGLPRRSLVAAPFGVLPWNTCSPLNSLRLSFTSRRPASVAMRPANPLLFPLFVGCQERSAFFGGGLTLTRGWLCS